MRYTEQEKEWLKENYPKLGEKETARQFNELFNHSQKAHSLGTYCSGCLGVSVSAEVRSINSSRNHNHGYLNVNGKRFYKILYPIAFFLLESIKFLGHLG